MLRSPPSIPPQAGRGLLSSLILLKNKRLLVPTLCVNGIDLRNNPFALSLSKGVFSWFDKLTTNGKKLKSMPLTQSVGTSNRLFFNKIRELNSPAFGKRGGIGLTGMGFFTAKP